MANYGSTVHDSFTRV